MQLIDKRLDVRSTFRNKGNGQIVNNAEDASRNFEVKLINTQGLTKAKLIELMDLTHKNTIMYITETHLKSKKLLFPTCISVVESMRDEDDTKGGCLLIMSRSKGDIPLKKEKQNVQTFYQ